MLSGSSASMRIVQIFLSLLAFIPTCFGGPTNTNAAAPAPPKLRNTLGNSSLQASPIIGESALIDKETGRIFWQGGSATTLSASLSPLLFGEIGVRHLRATALSCLLLLALVSSLVAWLRNTIEESSLKLSDSYYIKTLLFVLNWTILRIPKLDSRFVSAVYLTYLLEAYTCSTRRYLANAISSPIELEEYIEKLRHEPPVVTWKVRCFHYERRRWLDLLLLAPIWKRIRGQRQGDEFDSGGTAGSLLTKKKATHHASTNYTFTSFEDNTVAGVWKRAEATRGNSAPFAKIILSKLLVLSNSKAREDYFRQQSNFVTMEGSVDEYAEFSTSIQVHGFKPRMLAVRPVEGHRSAKLFRLNNFWVFTMLGLTVPFRIWFARHCDELRVTVTKETSTSKPSSKSWFSWSSTRPQDTIEGFKRVMQELSLYTKAEETGETLDDETQEIIEDIEVSAVSALEMNQANETRIDEEDELIVPKNMTDTEATESKEENTETGPTNADADAVQSVRDQDDDAT